MKFILVFLLSLFCLGAFSADSHYCPMKCEGAKTYEKPGSCPVCGMNLEPVEAGEKARPLNTREYRMELVTTPAEPKAAEGTFLKLALRKTADNSIVKALDVVHDKIMHLIVVSQDLAWFVHEHPEQAEDGSLEVKLNFPDGGNYVLYADVTPKGERNQVFPLAVSVGGKKRSPEPLKVSGTKKRLGEYEVTLTFDSPYAGSPSLLKYRVKSKGKDVTDLQPYLGAMGHSVTVSEDTTEFLHAHPPGAHHHHGDSAPAMKGGPEISFTTTFPRAGLYKTWVQFRHRGQIQTTDFVIRVQPPKRKA